MNKFKYITYIEDGLEKYILFDRLTNHSDFRRENILGAGFVRAFLHDDDIVSFQCYGKSVSLGRESRGSLDSLIINNCYRQG